MFSTASSLSWISACLLLLCLGDVSVPVSAQKYFRQVVERTQMWAPRENAALHWINRTTTFRDGLRDGKQVTLSNYFVSSAAHIPHPSA